MTETPEEWETRQGELGVGFIAFGGLPFNLTDEEAEEMLADLREAEERRISLGFGR